MRIASEALVLEGSPIPRGYRIWRWDTTRGHACALPIPFCYLARLLYVVWAWSYRFRPTALDRKARGDYAAGYQAGYDDGVDAGKDFVYMRL